MPAAAVIPAPIVYIKVVVIKTLVVEETTEALRRFWRSTSCEDRRVFKFQGRRTFGWDYFEKNRVFKAKHFVNE